MTRRILSLAIFLGSIAVAVTWLTLLPLLTQLLDGLRRLAPAGSAEAEMMLRARAVLPFYLAANLVVLAAACALILHLALGRPLRRVEAQVEQLGQLNLDLPLSSGGGPMLSRIQSSLRRMAGALSEEQALTRRQLDELRAAYERLGRAHAELAASERLATVGRLAAGIAHEVGNPLSGILGYLSLVRARAGDDAELRDYVDRVEAEVQRINEIVRGLLDLGRPAGTSWQVVQLDRLVRTCVDLVRAGPDLKGREVTVEIPEGLVGKTDPGPLSQVLINLLINAGQAVGEGGHVQVKAREDGDAVTLTVEDDGPGIPGQVLARLFQPFVTTKPAGKGSGLGLAVSEHLARTLGGTLTAHNRSQGGASFTLRLPVPR
jgi:two-component system NtrC family sensor kinase